MYTLLRLQIYWAVSDPSKYHKNDNYEMILKKFNIKKLTTGNIINKEFSFYELPTKLDIFYQETFEKSKKERR